MLLKMVPLFSQPNWIGILVNLHRLHFLSQQQIPHYFLLLSIPTITATVRTLTPMTMALKKSFYLRVLLQFTLHTAARLILWKQSFNCFIPSSKVLFPTQKSSAKSPSPTESKVTSLALKAIHQLVRIFTSRSTTLYTGPNTLYSIQT